MPSTKTQKEWSKGPSARFKRRYKNSFVDGSSKRVYLTPTLAVKVDRPRDEWGQVQMERAFWHKYKDTALAEFLAPILFDNNHVVVMPRAETLDLKKWRDGTIEATPTHWEDVERLEQAIRQVRDRDGTLPRISDGHPVNVGRIGERVVFIDYALNSESEL